MTNLIACDDTGERTDASGGTEATNDANADQDKNAAEGSEAGTEPGHDPYYCLEYCRVAADCGKAWDEDELGDCVEGCRGYIEHHAVPHGALCVAAVVHTNVCVSMLACDDYETWLDADVDSDSDYPCRDAWEYEAKMCAAEDGDSEDDGAEDEAEDADDDDDDDDGNDADVAD